MKKMIASVLALILCAAMSTTVFAASPIETEDGSDTKDVKGTYAAGTPGGTVYSVDVTWGAMEFTYTAASAGVWNPTTHTYDGTQAGGWSCEADANKITVTNHSNVAVTAELSFADSGTGTGITGGFYNASTGGWTVSSIPMFTAVGTQYTRAPWGEAYFQITGGSLTSGQENVTIGTITVELD